MSKEEFLNRLANPERCEILDWINLLQNQILTREVFHDAALTYYENEPGVHTIKVIAPRRSAIYSLITTIRNKFPISDWDAGTVELIETSDTDEIYFTFAIVENDHIPLK